MNSEHPELLIVATDDPYHSTRLAIRMVDLGVWFAFEPPYVLPGELPQDLSGFKSIVIDERKAEAVRDRLDAFRAGGGRVRTPGEKEWLSESYIERTVVQGGLTLNHPAMRERLESVPDRMVLDAALSWALQYDSPAWNDVQRYYVETLTEAYDLTGDTALIEHAGRIVDRAVENKPDAAQNCDYIACLYAFMGYLRHAEREGLLDLCRQFIDDYLARAPRYRDVLSNYLRPDSEGVLRAEIAFQACPAFARLAKRTGEAEYADVSVQQILAMNRELADEETGLWYLGRGQGGRTPSLWGRGVAFCLRGVVDTLAELPDDHPHRGELIGILSRMAASMKRFQDADGNWRQIVDEPDARVESSTISWTVAGLAKAVRLGLLDDGQFAECIAKGWLAAKRLSWNGLGTRICGGVTASMDPEYYRHRHFMPCSYGHFHLLAAVEVLRRSGA